MLEPQRPVRAYLFLLFGVLSFSFSPILVRLAGADAPGIAIAVWRTGISALLLAPFAAVRARREWETFGRKEWAFIGAAGALLALHFITWIESLYLTSVASATVIVSASPLFLAVFGVVLLKERLSWFAGSAIAVSVIGSALIGLADASSDAFPHALLGNGLSLIACLFVAGYLLIGRVVRRKMSWLGYVFPLYAVTALTCLAASIILRAPLTGFGWAFYGLCFLMAVGPQILGHGSLNYAVRYMPAAYVGLATLLEPVAASIIAIFLFSEVPRPMAAVGMAIVLFGITLLFLPAILRRKRRWGERHSAEEN